MHIRNRVSTLQSGIAGSAFRHMKAAAVAASRPFPEKTQKALYAAAVIFTGCCIIGLLFFHVMGYTAETFLPGCYLYRLTGYYCPGCGGTRAIRALLHGNVPAAIWLHPFVAYAFLMFFLFLSTYTLHAVLPRLSFPRFRLRPLYFYAAIALILVNWILKNILIYLGCWS
ncbi:MAG: DUF2752 domain-containing protein [Enterocloster asparagiformis]|nr:DUF2752 domain-containing protein [Enterocloster asparagiformis]